MHLPTGSPWCSLPKGLGVTYALCLSCPWLCQCAELVGEHSLLQHLAGIRRALEMAHLDVLAASKGIFTLCELAWWILLCLYAACNVYELYLPPG